MMKSRATCDKHHFTRFCEHTKNRHIMCTFLECLCCGECDILVDLASSFEEDQNIKKQKSCLWIPIYEKVIIEARLSCKQRKNN